MLVIPPPKYQKTRGKPRVLPLLLSRATYQSGVSLTLTFNQPVEISAFDGSQIDLKDGPGGHTYTGAGASLVDPRTIRIDLTVLGTFTGPILLSINSDVGIKALMGQQTWQGCDGIGLPFP